MNDKPKFLYCCFHWYYATGEGHHDFATFIIGDDEEVVRDKFYEKYLALENNPMQDDMIMEFKKFFNATTRITPIKEYKKYPEKSKMLITMKEFAEATGLCYILYKKQINGLYRIIKDGGMTSYGFVYKIDFNLG